MDDSEYDSDFEEIQLFTSTVPASNVTGIQRLPGTITPSLAGTNSTSSTEKSATFPSHQVESQKSTISVIQPDLCNERGLEACENEKVAIERKIKDAEPKKDSNIISSCKRLLENKDESQLTCKRQKLLEQTELVKKDSDTSVSMELGVPAPYNDIAVKMDNNAATNCKINQMAETEDENCDAKIKGQNDTIITSNSDIKIKRETSPINNIDLPPIAIVSPLPEKIPSTSNSPDNFADKLDVKGFTEEESAVISKLADYDPSMIDNSPSALHDLFKSIFPDKQDTFQTSDGNEWTFSDLQQNETAISPEQINEKEEDSTCNMKSENDNPVPKSHSMNEVQVYPVVKKEAQSSVSDLNHDSEVVTDFFSGQSIDQKVCEVMEPKKEILAGHTCKESTHMKAEHKLLDCGLQENSVLGDTSKNYFKYSVPKESIASPRSVPVPRRSGYDGLIKTGPPNCNVTDFARQDIIASAGDKIPYTVQNNPLIQSILTDQNFQRKPMPTISMGQHPVHKTSQAWLGYNNERFPCSNTTKPHQKPHHTERTSNMNKEGFQPSNTLFTLPRQPSSVQQSMSAIQMHQQGSSYQLPRQNSSSHHPGMPEMNIPRGGYTIQNSAPVIQSTYQQSYLPQTQPSSVNQTNLSQRHPYQNYPPVQKVIPDHGFKQPFSLCNDSLTQNNHFQYTGAVGQSSTVNSQQSACVFSSNSGILGQPSNGNFQGHPPKHYFNLSGSQGNGGHQRFSSPLQSRNSAEQQQLKEFQNNPLNQLQNITNSSPWQENVRTNNNASLSTVQNPSHDSFSASHANFTQANQSLITLKEKLVEVINLAKVVPSQEIKCKVQAFLLRAKNAKQLNLNDHDKQAFVEETKRFILEVTDLIYKTNKDTWRSNYYNTTQTTPNANIGQSHIPMSSHNSVAMAAFNSSGLFMQQNQGAHIQTQKQSPSASSSGVFGFTDTVDIHQNFNINGGAVGNLEESYNDLNPLERFVL